MTTIFITGIGGSIGVDIARSLRFDPSLRLIGADSSPWGLKIGERLCDDLMELPRADVDPERFQRDLDQALEATASDFVFVNPDPELEALAALARLPGRPNPIPAIRETAICLDKAVTVEQAESSEDFPRTFPIHSTEDVTRAFAELQTPIWLRATVGPGGRGSLPVSRPEEVDFWMTYWRRQGRRDQWVLQEYLPGRNLNWTGLFRCGELLASAAMERLRYFLGNATVSGVSGQVALCATVDPQEVEAVARRVIAGLGPEPSGLYSVDLRLAADGKAKVTEINPRLAGRPWLYTNAGVNLPLATVRAFAGVDPGDAIDPGGLRLGLHLYRQLDVDPVFGPAPRR